MTALDWHPLDYDPPARLAGHGAVLERLDPGRHGRDLFASNGADAEMWRHMPYGPFADPDAYHAWAEGAAASDDPAFYAIRGDDGPWTGVASLMRIDRGNGVIEIGHIALSAALRRTRTATAALHLMIAQAFETGFRRVEWKCNAENGASRRAAARLGFAYEGTFRQHMVVKDRNRDTAWFAILDGDWPAIRTAHLAWLDPANFDGSGWQVRAMATAVGRDPG
ncbi:MAG: GNAT family protein [Pseudomonadota bacterium]